MIYHGATTFDPPTEYSAYSALPDCDHPGCENVGENEVNGWFFCTKHYNEITFNENGDPEGDLP